MGSRLTTAQKNDLQERRRKLEARIANFQRRASEMMKLDEDVTWIRDSDDDISDRRIDHANFPDGTFTPELQRLSFPSALEDGEIDRMHLEWIAELEAKLRRGQITDSLEGLRMALGEKSLCFRTEVRNADSQRTTQRSWANIHKYDDDARRHRLQYRTARRALKRLPCETEYLSTLHDITDEDLKVSGDLTDERRVGQRNDALAWFWRVDGGLGPSEMNAPRMHECTYAPQLHQWPLTICLLVYRVSWLRARARFLRWSEESRLVPMEMKWTVKWFSWQMEKWENRLQSIREDSCPPGLEAYCHKQIALWEGLKLAAEKRFLAVLGVETIL